MSVPSTSEQIEGLLHLAAMAVVVTAAYIGLDRIRGESNRFKSRLHRVQARVTILLQKLDILKSGKATLKDIYNNAPMHVLCHVAKIKISLGFMRPIHAVKRQRYIPLLGYFRHRADQWVVGIMLIYSLTTFLLLVAALLWSEKMSCLTTAGWLEFDFFGLSAVVVWIFFTVAISYRLRDISTVCGRFEKEVDAYVKNIYDEAAISIRKTAAQLN